MHSGFARGYGTKLSESNLDWCGKWSVGRTWGRGQ